MAGVSTFHGLNTTLRGLLAHQRSIDTTGHNIANADTVGYSRQEATLGTSSALKLPAGTIATGGQAFLGTGVDTMGYRRIRETFLDLQYRAQNMRLGEQSTTSRSLEQVELSLAEPSDNGMSALMGKLWSAWGDVANMPESAAARQAVVDSAANVTAALGTLDSQLTLASGQAQAEFNALVAPNSEIDLAAREIAQLNSQIKQAIASGGQPNDLLDRRDLLLDNLSGYAQLTVTDLGGGSMQVAFSQDPPLPAVELVNDTAVTFAAATLTNPLSGRLGALHDIYRVGGTVDTYRAQLDSVASQLAAAVNAVHGAPPFFTGSTAATIAVGVTAATLKTTATGAAGANEIALAMSELRYANPPANAPDAAYRTLVSSIGTDVREARRLEANAQALVNGVEQRRMATSGVSLDEEMTNLVRFQRGYQASARAMSSVDEMLDQLINRTGRVGL